MEIKTDTKSKIMHSAIILFPKLGYENTSMRRIAEEVGITKPALYYYYKNKEELFKSIVDFGNDFSWQKILKIRNDDTTIRQKLKDMALIKFNFMHDNDEVRQFSGWLTTDGMKYLMKYDIDIEIDKQMKVIYEILDDAKEKGELRKDLDSEAFLYMLFGAANVYLRRFHAIGEYNFSEEKIDNLIDTLLRDATK